MKLRYYLVVTLSIFLQLNAFSQTGNWTSNPADVKVFIEGKGQYKLSVSDSFEEEVKYAFDSDNEDFYFTNSGVVLQYRTIEQRVRTQAQKDARKERKKAGFASREEFLQFEMEGNKNKITEDQIEAQWVGANKNVEIIAEGKSSFYHNFSYREGDQIKSLEKLSSFKKLTYKNLYPQIDVVYELHPQGGLKYSVIVHPGGDISKVKLKYSKDIVLNADGTISTDTKFGRVIDHAPVTFYENNQGSKIESSYSVEGNVISFTIGTFDTQKTIVIDPWTQSPAFATNWDCVWECEKDAAGNAYLIGGVMPMQLIKYNSAGTLQWTYNTPYDTTAWLGTFAVDNAGNSYVTLGSAAKIQKVSTAGALIWDNPSPGGLLALTEFWNITFNCDQTKLVIGGTDGNPFGGPKPYIFDVNMSNGNVTNALQVHESVLFNDQEVRSIIPCNNAKYYFLTQDTIGYVHQSLTSCVSSAGGPFHVSNGFNLGYKCENYRRDNAGIMALAYYNGFVFVHRGNLLEKRDFATANVLATVAIPGGVYNTSGFGNSVGCSGIDIDDCGNIFVGSSNGVYKFNQSLSQTGSFATTFNVYDVEVSTAGDVIAAGSTGNSGSANRTGSIQSFAASACTPQATVCCDATICTPTPLCTTDAPLAYTTTTSGGTWTASCGSCINATTGVFNPAVSGAGTFTITYTLSCGSETQTVNVYTCTPLTACLETNGDITVSGGNGPFDWTEFLPAQTTPITTQAECTACNSSYTWLVNSCLDGVVPVANCASPAGYYPLGTGTTVTPGTNFPIVVEDASGQTLTINSLGSLAPCTACPTLTVSTSSIVNVNCFGQSTGSFNASTSGGASPYDYTLLQGSTTIATFNNVAGSQAFTTLPSGTYTLNVVDNNGCPGTTTVTITQNTAISVSQTANTPASCGNSNGSATVNATGGSGAFTYSWNSTPTQTGATATGLAAGPYVVTATDALGCSQTFNVTITNTGGPTVTIGSPVNPTCNNGTNGTATANVTGGSGTITYSWSPSGGSAATGTNLSGGVVYTVTVTDGNNCQATATITLTNPTAITINTTSTDATCGQADGSLTANATGGTGTLDYSWNTSPVQNTATATSVPSGNYIVTVTDDNGCTATATESVNNTGAPTITLVSQNNLDCNGDTDGSATVSGSGGNGTLTFSWNTTPAQTGTTATNLPGGTYIATVTDASGCSSSINVTITEPAAVTGVATSTPTNCAGSTGTATVVASGGDGNYTYLWSNNGITSTINGLAPGVYSVTITDGNGCTGTATTTVVTSTVANIDAGTDVVIVSGTSTTLTATGGITYVWTPSDSLSCTNCSSPVANPSQTTTYYVTGTDANGCIGVDSVTVFVEDPCGEIWVPTAFSPNGDATNEMLCVYGGCIKNLTFQLFDRWGNMVFETTDNSLCWDGMYKGKPMNTAVLAYYLYAELDNGDVVEKKGNITLVK